MTPWYIVYIYVETIHTHVVNCTKEVQSELKSLYMNFFHENFYSSMPLCTNCTVHYIAFYQLFILKFGFKIYVLLKGEMDWWGEEDEKAMRYLKVGSNLMHNLVVWYPCGSKKFIKEWPTLLQHCIVYMLQICTVPAVRCIHCTYCTCLPETFLPLQ